MPEQVDKSKPDTHSLAPRLPTKAGLPRGVSLMLAVASATAAGGAHAQQVHGHRQLFMIEKRDMALRATQPDAKTVPFEIGLLAAGLSMLAHLARSNAPARFRKRAIATV